VRLAPSDTADLINLNKIFQEVLLRLKNAFSGEIRSEQAFARILHWQYFRLFQQNRPDADLPQRQLLGQLIGVRRTQPKLTLEGQGILVRRVDEGNDG
jgi:hypothetical protein